MGETGFDRSPCGTGTSGWVAALHARGKPVEKIKIGDFDGVIPEITGRAYITAFHDFVLDPRDPYPEGFNFPGL